MGLFTSSNKLRYRGMIVARVGISDNQIADLSAQMPRSKLASAEPTLFASKMLIELCLKLFATIRGEQVFGEIRPADFRVDRFKVLRVLSTT